MDIREHFEISRTGVNQGSRQPLAGQKALVTGANSGIGKAVAIAMADAGAAVAINYITDEDAAYAVKDPTTTKPTGGGAEVNVASSDTDDVAAADAGMSAASARTAPTTHCGLILIGLLPDKVES